MLIFLDICTKNNYFSDLKKSTFSMNLDIFEDVGKKRIFSKWFRKNVILLKMLIFQKYGQKRYFQSDDNVLLIELFTYEIRNVHIFGDMRKKLFLKVISKEKSLSAIYWYIRLYRQTTILSKWFFTKCWYFWTYGQKTIF